MRRGEGREREKERKEGRKETFSVQSSFHCIFPLPIKETDRRGVCDHHVPPDSCKTSLTLKPARRAGASVGRKEVRHSKNSSQRPRPGHFTFCFNNLADLSKNMSPF